MVKSEEFTYKFFIEQYLFELITAMNNQYNYSVFSSDFLKTIQKILFLNDIQSSK